MTLSVFVLQDTLVKGKFILDPSVPDATKWSHFGHKMVKILWIRGRIVIVW